MLALKQQQRWTTTAFHGLRSAGHRTVLTRCGLVTSTRVNSTDPVNKNQNDSHATHDDVSPAYLPPSGRRLLQLKDQLRKQHAKMGRPASAKGRSTVPHNARKRPALPPYRDLPVVDDKLKFRAFYTDGNRTGASALLARNGVSGKVTVDHFLDALYPRGAATGVTVEDDGASTMKAIVDGKDEPVRSVANALFADQPLCAMAMRVGMQHVLLKRDEDLGHNLLKFIRLLETVENTDYVVGFAERRHLFPSTVKWSEWTRSLRSPVKTLDNYARQYYTSPIAMRLLNESGRQSPMPIFVVGAFCGTQKLGEGIGQSLLQARRAAARDALERMFEDRELKRLPRQELDDSRIRGDVEKTAAVTSSSS